MRRIETTTVIWEMDEHTSQVLEGIMTAVHDWVYSNPRNAATLADQLNTVMLIDPTGVLSEAVMALVPSEHFAAWRSTFASNTFASQ